MIDLKYVTISEKMRFNKIVELLPDSLEIFKEAGLQCISCCSLPSESLEEVMKAENFNQEEIKKVLQKLQELKMQKEQESMQKPEKSDFNVQEIIEGNKKYYKLAGMMISEIAYQNLHALATNKGLQIRLITGGCSGFKHQYEFQDQAQDDESEFPLSDKLKIFINDFTYNKLHGSIVDFKVGLHDSGLKIINPNMKRSCSCGTSFGF